MTGVTGRLEPVTPVTDGPPEGPSTDVGSAVTGSLTQPPPDVRPRVASVWLVGLPLRGQLRDGQITGGYGAGAVLAAKSAKKINRHRSHGGPGGGWSYSWTFAGNSCPQRAKTTSTGRSLAGGIRCTQKSCLDIAQRAEVITKHQPLLRTPSSQPLTEDAQQRPRSLLVQPQHATVR